MINYEKYTLEQFILEFCPFRSKYIFKNIGIEFNYKGQDYRMCKEPFGTYSKREYTLYKIISIIPGKTLYDTQFNYETLGVYKTIDQLLDTKVIDGNRAFASILFDEENTEILSFD